MATQMGEQDLNSFLDFGDIDINFAGFDQTGQSDRQLLQQQSHQHQQIAQPSMENVPLPATSHGNGNPQPANMFDFNVNMAFGEPQSLQFMGDTQVPHALQGGILPPTPNSAQMHTDALRYIQQLEAENRSMMVQQYHLRKAAEAVRTPSYTSPVQSSPVQSSRVPFCQNTDRLHQANFTPLVSPAVTEHEAGFNYTVPGAYFSPLTSPALEGQQYSYQATTSASSVAASSPVDRDVEMTEAASQNRAQFQRTKKRTETPRSNGSKTKAQPAKGTRRKSALLSVAAPKEVRDIVRNASKQQPNLSPISPSGQATHTSAESISPEPLSEPVMGPPQKPASAMQSPAIVAKTRSPLQGPREKRPAPATPASLMMLQQQARGSSAVELSQAGVDNDLVSPSEQLEDLTLPASAHDDHSPGIDQGTLLQPARKTPKIGPLSTPSGSATPLSASRAAPSTPLNSPSTNSFGSRKTEPKGRNSKKRTSVSSGAMASPALRPKISPSIQPKIPEGGMIVNARN
jgi:hypothetical protein